MTSVRFRPMVESLLYVYVDNIDQDVSGRIFNFSNEMSEYEGLTDLLLKSERFFNTRGYPQPYYTVRDFSGPRKISQNIQTEEASLNMQNEMTEAHQLSADFIIRVRCRQNATWQGEITWVDEGKNKTFSSGLEMIRLLDQAIQERSGKKDEQGWE